MEKLTKQKLFDYFAQEHNINLMESDFNEIDNIINQKTNKIKVCTKIQIIGSFCYNGNKIIAKKNLIIKGAFDFKLVKNLIFLENKENYPLFNTLSEILELNKFTNVQLDCILMKCKCEEYYDILNCKIIY